MPGKELFAACAIIAATTLPGCHEMTADSPSSPPIRGTSTPVFTSEDRPTPDFLVITSIPQEDVVRGTVLPFAPQRTPIALTIIPGNPSR